ncbi:MAG: periplasmic heavy metal sensor [Thermoanaerobaculia bacterium]
MHRTLISALSLTTLLAVPAFASHPGNGPPPGPTSVAATPRSSAPAWPNFPVQRLTRALDLTTEQQARLANLQRGFSDAVRPLFESMRTTRDELENALEAARPDPAAVGTKAIAMHSLQGGDEGGTRLVRIRDRSDADPTSSARGIRRSRRPARSRPFPRLRRPPRAPGRHDRR